MTKKRSNYDGYIGMDKKGRVIMGGEPTRMDRARGAAEGFRRDYEGMRTVYENYKRPGAPDAKTTEKQILQGSEQAIARVQGANVEYDNERRREENRMASMGKTRLTTQSKKY